MSVPEASVYQDYRPVSWQNDVWSSREILGMQPKAKPGPVQKTAHNFFRCGVLTSNAGHHPAASLPVYDVSQNRMRLLAILGRWVVAQVFWGFAP
jgi:hypothetical protein